MLRSLFFETKTGCTPLNCVKQENNRKTKALLNEYHYNKGNNNYFFNEILDCIGAKRCIDCITDVIQYADLSYEAMKEDNFDVWFFAIKRDRLDVLEKLIEYGCERYSEYRDSNGADSYLALFRTATLLGNFNKILELFLAAGIPILSEDGCIFTFLEDCKNKINVYRWCTVSTNLEKYK